MLAVGWRYAGLLLLLAAGLGLSRFFPSLRALSLPLRLGHGYLLGVASLGGTLFALSHWAGMPLNRPAILLVAAPPALLGLFEIARYRSPRRSGKGVTRPALVLLVGTATVVSAALLIQAASVPLTDSDGRMTWGTQARYMSAAATVDAPVLRDAQEFVSHPRYPPLLPLCQVASIALGSPSADWDERSFRPLYAAFFPAFLGLIFCASRRWAGTSAAAWAALAASLVPFLAFGSEGGAAGAYSDLPLACFWGAGCLQMLRARLALSEGLLGGIFLAAAVLTKNEGAPLAIIALGLAASQVLLRHRRAVSLSWVPLGAALAPVAAAIVLLYSWRSKIPIRYDESYFQGLRPLELVGEAAARSKVLVPAMLQKMGSFETWSALWWIAPILFLAGYRGLLKPPATRVALAFVAPLAIGWAAYARHRDPLYLVDVTWDRFLLQAAAPLFVTFAFLIRRMLLDFRRPPAP